MSELPFLKNKQKKQGGGEPEEREPDSISGDHLLRMITDEFHDALERKDHKGLLDALRAFVNHVQSEDQDG